MSITLQGTAPFDPEFVGQLSRLGRALLKAGFDPSTVQIVKHRASGAAEIGGDPFEYLVRVDDIQFEMIAKDDARFLDQLLARIRDGTHVNAALAQRPGLFARVTRWITQ